MRCAFQKLFLVIRTADRAFRPEWRYLLAVGINNKKSFFEPIFRLEVPRLSICLGRNRTYQTTVRAKAIFFSLFGTSGKNGSYTRLLFTIHRVSQRRPLCSPTIHCRVERQNPTQAKSAKRMYPEPFTSPKKPGNCTAIVADGLTCHVAAMF